jgi:hypothetical protein
LRNLKMKDISELKVKQIRIFAADRIPFATLRTALGQKSLAELFSWSEIGANPATGELIYNAGVLQPATGKPIVVDSLQINDRRIVLEVAGETAHAGIVYSGLAELLARYDLGGRWKDAEPVVLVHETSCVVTMDFEWSSLLSAPFLCFTQRMIPALSSEAAAANIIGIKCGIIFSYALKDQTIREHGISLSNKPFSVEPRVNTPLSERRYFTSSPTDSDTHMDLLRKLEAAMSEEAVPKKHKR